MKSSTTNRFWKCYDGLPEEVKKKAKDAYGLFTNDPYYPSMHFKRIHSTRPIFSIRITKDFRAAGILEGDEITWFWIGSHKECDILIKRLRNT